MKEQFEFSDSENTNYYIERFEEMLKRNEQYFFDVEEFEDIIDFYLNKNNPGKALEAIKLASLQHPASTEILIKKAQVFADANKPQKAVRNDVLDGKAQHEGPTLAFQHTMQLSHRLVQFHNVLDHTYTQDRIEALIFKGHVQHGT